MMDQKGIALISVLWICMLLAVIAASFLGSSRTTMLLARNARENARAEALADAGIHDAIVKLLEADQSPPPFSYAFGLAAGEVDVRVTHEGGKVDLNFAGPELLAGLFRANGSDEPTALALSDAIIDFRDEDYAPREFGAEDGEYLVAGLRWGAKDAPFTFVSELQQVIGMTAGLYRRISPLVTVYSWQRGINPLTAPPRVLMALPGIEREQVEAFLAARREWPSFSLNAASGTHLAPTSEDASPILVAAAFSRQQSLNKRLQATRRPASRQPEKRDDGDLANFVSLERVPVFSIRSSAMTQGGARFVRDAVVSVDKDHESRVPYRIHWWTRGKLDRPRRSKLSPRRRSIGLPPRTSGHGFTRRGAPPRLAWLSCSSTTGETKKGRQTAWRRCRVGSACTAYRTLDGILEGLTRRAVLPQPPVIQRYNPVNGRQRWGIGILE